MKDLRHIPVLAREIYENLPEKLNYYFDGTLGHGGHVQFILENLEQNDKIKFSNLKTIGLDRDHEMIDKAKTFLNKYKNKILFFQSSYSNPQEILKNIGINEVDFFLLDIGVNLEHFKNTQRGFSIKGDAPLDMRFDRNQNFDAKTLLNTYTFEQLSELLQKYGDFSKKYADFIAKNIKDKNKKEKLVSTLQLTNFLKGIGINARKIAVIFQVIRIEVNQELKQLEEFLENFVNSLSKGGRCMIISYHSIEDRMVKQKFKRLSESGEFLLINKHVIVPNYKEVQLNKAASSAKLRILQKN